MLQVYYLSTPDREHRFDAVFQQLDVVATFFSVGDVSSLVNLVTREKTINQQDFIVCDLSVATWSDEHILSAVQLLRSFSVVQMIFLAPPGERTTGLFKHLAEQRVDGLIIDQGDPSGQLHAALQGDNGYMHRLSSIQRAVTEAAEKEVSPLRIPPGLVLDVAVCGAMQRVGATTQIFGLYHYFTSLGFRPAVLDNGQPAIRTLIKLYQDKAVEREHSVEINGVNFAKGMSENFDVYLHDYGVLVPELVSTVCGADLTVYVGGVKPWELPALAAGYLMLTEDGHPNELAILASFAAAEDLETVKQYVSNCTAVPYHPDIWMPGSDMAYRATVLPALKRLCGDV